MKTFGQEVKSRPSLSSDKINKLRLSLIKEEFDELENAMNKKDLVEVAFDVSLEQFEIFSKELDQM